MATKQLSKDEILHLAKLANLTLNDKEIALYQDQLSNIIGYIEKLDSVNTDNIEPIEQLTEQTNVTAEDIESDERHLSQDQVTQNTKEHKDGHIRVNAIFDNE
jgi:aspartyl-tRNA(Asn)/glutamyl-tRNA(Gln) amidotransferase subunit C